MKIKGRLVKKDEQNIYLATWDGKTLKIPKEGINKLKVKKFSYLKTGGFIGMTSLGLFGIYLFLDGIGASMYQMHQINLFCKYDKVNHNTRKLKLISLKTIR